MDQAEFSSVLNRERVMTTADLTRALHISRTGVWQALKDGALPKPNFRIGSRSPRWIWGSVLDHLERRAKQARDSAEL